MFLLGSVFANAQSRKFYFSPNLDLGIASGYSQKNALKLDLGNSGEAINLGFRLGYYLNNNVSVFTGLEFGMYDYDMRFGSNPIAGLDTVRIQSQNNLEIPLGVRYTTFPKKQFKARHYLGAGLKVDLLNDARSSYHTVDGSYYFSETKTSDFNFVYLRLFVEAGLDIPLDYNSAFLVGVSLSDGITRNMSKTGLVSNANYGMLVGNLTVGFRFGLF
ncbi:MAG: outer membrane beta-barrel protein [Chitinophagaceae bacterium]